MYNRILDQEDHFLLLAQIGDVVEREVESVVVLRLLERAKAEAVQAMKALLGADPSNERLVRNLQNEVNRFLDMQSWILADIEAGRNAENALTGE